MKDLRRIQAECQLLERNYGTDRVYWATNLDWVLIDDFRLPPSYNQQSSRVLVLMPEHYGYGQPYRDLFISTGLLLWHRGQWKQLPHYFEKFPYSSLNDEFVDELRDKNWSYLCLHPDNWKTTDNILTFLVQVYTFLCDPFHDWDNHGQTPPGYSSSYADEDEYEDEDEDDDEEDEEDNEDEDEHEY